MESISPIQAKELLQAFDDWCNEEADFLMLHPDDDREELFCFFAEIHNLPDNISFEYDLQNLSKKYYESKRIN